MAEKTKLAVVLTAADETPGIAGSARVLGYEVDIPRRPSVEGLMRRLPDLIMIDWEPSQVRSNRALVKNIRSVSILAQVPIGIFYSNEDDLKGDLLGTSRIFALKIPFHPELMARQVRKVTGEDWPIWPPPDIGSPSFKTARATREIKYVDESRLQELGRINSANWDLKRLVHLVEELNIAYALECYIACAMLLRAIADHVPPIFGCKSFAEVANNYGGSKSFRDSMQHLNNSLRNIADAQLHVQVRRSEVLPNRTQVDFRADLDVLLGEVVRIVR